METVFVYGTLKAGHHNHYLLKRATYIGQAAVQGFRMFDFGGFPAAAPYTRVVRSIAGELYSIDRTTRKTLDRLEGVPTLYTAERVVTTSGVETLMYVINPSQVPIGCGVIAGGVW